MTCTVAIIGCGPSGMFIQHALALRKKQLQDEGNLAAVASLPQLTCFERGSSPGGVWRADRNAGETNMYEALFTNGPKETIEFFDYTFDEHFSRALPTFLPRSLILEYMLARCTKHDQKIFDDVKFNTSVESVTFNEEKGKFVVQTIDLKTQIVMEDMFDKCIWAAGDNGKPSIPKSIANTLSSGGFKGMVMHSAATGADFDQLVCGKKILLVGDSYSAEDLTLMAIKLGVKSVDVLSRSAWGVACGTASWPRNCVEVHEQYAIVGVSDGGRGIVIENEEEEDQITLNEIDTVIFCTGYSMNMDMLDPSLRLKDKGPFFSDYEEFHKQKMGWKMTKNHLSKDLGDVPIGKIVDYNMICPDLYRGHLLSNPNMMFMMGRLDAPLLDLDVQAWLLLAHLTDDITLPSEKDMKRFNLQALMDELQDPYIRAEIDKNYDDHWDDSLDDDHWMYQFGDKRAREIEKNTLTLQCRFLARDMIDASYPLDLGTYKKLNGKAKDIVEMQVVSGFDFHQLELVEGSRDSSWKTFRDGNPTNIRSIMTGTKAVPFKCHWLDLEGDGIDDICGTPAPLNLKGKGKSKATAMKKMLQAIRPPCVTSRAHVDEDGRDAKAAATE
mmetsp:Transcript_12627/g.19053  ORF Transcript_12627/g.19053 Transcript_12627/m.19053 type:complete len:611 (-) Transcript_12627:155-1987(-)|eukprot:scaffold4233_cov142-Skeletonema_dohrnii-CCMP3373.AAC.3